MCDIKIENTELILKYNKFPSYENDNSDLGSLEGGWVRFTILNHILQFHRNNYEYINAKFVSSYRRHSHFAEISNERKNNHYYLDLISYKEMIEFVRVNRSQIGERELQVSVKSRGGAN